MPKSCVPSTHGCGAGSAWRRVSRDRPMWPSSRSTDWPSACATRRGASSWVPPAATVARARTSRPTCARSAPSPRCSPSRSTWRCVARSTCPRRSSRASTPSARSRVCRSTPTRATAVPARCASWIRGSRPAATSRPGATSCSRKAGRPLRARTRPWSAWPPWASRSSPTTLRASTWRASSPSPSVGENLVTTCLTRPTGSSSRSTGRTSRRAWGWSAGRRGGPSPTNSRPSRWRPWSRTSCPTSAGRGR